MKELTTIVLLLASHLLFAQEVNLGKKGFKYNNNLDASFSASDKQFALAGAFTHFHSIGSKKKFKIGYGLRLTFDKGKDLYYETAPAELTSKASGPQIIFTKIYTENIDSVYFKSTQTAFVNASVNFEYQLSSRLDAGFNIDVVGFTFASKSAGKYIAYQSPENNTYQSATSTPFNLLLVSDNDKGSLNSEFYLRYWATSKWGIRAGVSFLFTEYTTDHKLRLENDRWRNKSLQLLLGVTYAPFKN
jgi:hypothetical protein